MPIPKIIHQIYLQGEANIPENIKKSVSELRQRNPNWEYRFYDEPRILDYIQQHYGHKTLNTYLLINKNYSAARSDYFRYLLMYQEGGVYLDLKSSCAVPFDDILHEDDEFIICGWENEIGQKYQGYGINKHLKFLKNGEYQQWNIIAQPYSPFLKAVIDEVTFRIHDYTPMKYHVGRKGVLNTTGPVPYSIAIEKAKQNQNLQFRYERFAEQFGLIYINADTTVINKNHYRLQTNPVVKLNKVNYFLYKLWLYLLHPRKAFATKNK
jgi:mannosyltransferase OCH1-like enzyme